MKVTVALLLGLLAIVLFIANIYADVRYVKGSPTWLVLSQYAALLASVINFVFA